MNAFKFFLILVGIVLIFVGGRTTKIVETYETKIYEDSLNYYRALMKNFQEDSAAIQEAFSKAIPPASQFQTVPPSFDDPYLSASQGVEVILRGMEWKGKMLDSIHPVLRRQFGGRYTLNYNQLELDPDFPSCGYPDLIVTIPDAPSVYMDDKKSLSKFLRKKFKKEEPIESFNLKGQDGKRVRMDLWLAQFDIIFRVEPEKDHNRNNEIEFEGRHPITRESANSLRGNREFRNQRYSEMTLFLEFKPKDNWYVADESEEGFFQPDKQPHIGIAAVECVQVQKVGEKGLHNRDDQIGVSIENGQAIPLYNSLNEVVSNFADNYRNPNISPSVETVARPFYSLAEGSEDFVLNPNLFGKEKFSAVQIRNLGSWKEPKSWLLGKTEFEADLFKASFIIHLFVIGEWTVKGRSLVKTDLRPPTQVVKKGLFDYLLPDFKLGFFGKTISIVILLFVAFVFLSIFIKPFATIFNRMMKGLLGVFKE